MSASPLSSVVSAGIFYAEQYGFRILPVQKKGKRPILDNWTESASSDPDEVKRMLSRHKGNIGVACGPGSNLAVIDVDLPHGEETLAKLEAELGKLPETLTQRTGGGGRQLFFRYPQGVTIKNSAGENGKGLGVNVDVRGDGGQCVLPPSIHPSGRTYAWITKGVPPADLPPAWVERLKAKKPDRPQPRAATPTTRGGEMPPYVQAAIDDELVAAATAPQNTRNDTLNRAAFSIGQWAGSGYLCEEEARNRLYQAAVQSGLVADDGEHQVHKTISSGLSGGMREPRQVPPSTASRPSSPHGQTADAADGSEEVTPEESRILPPPPPVPLEAFPAEVAAMLEEASEAFTVPLQIPAACFLSLLSCLVGRARLICLKESWREAGNLWLAVVAQSGMGKSPLISAFFNVVDRLEYEAKKTFDAEYAEYEDLLLERQTQRAHNARAKARGKELDAGPVSLPDEPAQRQVTADDVTVEALGEILKANPKGVLWLKDELSGMLFDLDKYSSNGGGGTKARLLSSYDCKRWKTNRTSNPKRNIDIPKACVGIFGGIQPGMLTKAFEAGAGGTDEESGFLPRFIFIRAVTEAPGYWSERTFSRASMDLLDAIAAALWLWDIEYDTEGLEVERIVPVSRQAKALYVQWYNVIAEEAFISDNAALLAKLRGQAQRICLLLHSLDAALAGNDGMGIVTEDCMRRTLLLADWVKEHQEQCWRFFRPDEKAKQADPIERTIMQVVVDQAARIEADGWKISNADLCSLVEAKLNMPGLSAVKIGKAASRLGMGQCKVDRNSKGRSVTKETIDTFKSTVRTDRTDRTPYGSREKVADGCHFEPTATDRNSMPAWAVEESADGTRTDADRKESIDTQGVRTERMVRTDDLGYSPEFDFNDPAFPDEVKI